MINVKSLRPAAQPAVTPEDAYRKSQGEPAPSRWTGGLALALAAVAVYLSSIFPSLSKVAAEAPPGRGADDEAGAGPAAVTAAAAEESPEDETGSIDKKDAEPEPIGSGGPGTDLGTLTLFDGIDSPLIDYDQLPLPRFRPTSFENGFGAERPGNDNLGTVSSAAGSSGDAGSAKEFPTVLGVSQAVTMSPGPRGPFLVDAGDRQTEDPQTPPGGPLAGEGGPDDSPPPGSGPATHGSSAPRNRAPRLGGPVILADFAACQVFLITLADLLSGATDDDGDSLSVMALQTSSGTLTQAEGDWLFTQSENYVGPVTLSYQVSDGQVGVAQTASFNVAQSTEIDGTPGDDALLGTMCADVIQGYGGDDNIDARAGHDVIHGGSGNDHIVAGAGNDTVYGGAGHDIVFGGAGDDVIHGGEGHDRLYGEEGDDIIAGDEGDDLIVGGAGNDQLSGGAGGDEIHGDDGDDIIAAGHGSDVASGGAGNDTVDGGDGDDRLAGGSGDDTLIGGAGDDVIQAGDGNNLVDAGDGDDDVDAGDGDNLILTGAGNNRVVTGDGNNTVVAGGGADQIRTGSGNDVVFAGRGIDFVAAGAGADRVFGEAGDDTIFAGSGEDVVEGGDGDDLLVGEAGADQIDGGDGQDTIDAGSGDDDVEAGDGDDIVLGGTGQDRVDGGDGADRIAGGTGADTLDGGDGQDVVEGGDGDDLIVAALDADCDLYDGGGGHDLLDLSQTSHDVDVNLIAGTAIGIEIGQDTIIDLEAIVGGSGDDVFTVGSEAVTLTGGAGADIFTFDVSCGEANRDLIHKILDLEAGDRIEITEYQILQDTAGTGDPLFESTYGDVEDGSDLPFRFRIEKIGEISRTYIDVFIEQDDENSFTIEIEGSHKFYYA